MAGRPGSDPGEGLSVRSRVARTLLVLTSLGTTALVAGATALIAPFVWDDLRMDHAVRAVALDWRDFGRAKAADRLRFELARLEVNAALTEDSCTFDEGEGSKEVTCAWAVQIALPVGGAFPLAFESRASIAPDGDLR